ncbi:MAG TPA: DNA alkylation repair protein [Bacteroidales bacterium]|nr:DNA alkylation repair protein [Bacteroidales bacterium]
MVKTKAKEIRKFYEANSDPAIIKKYSRYFRDGYDGYGIDDELIRNQVENWKVQWKDMTLNDYLDLGDELQRGRYDEKNLAILFIQAKRGEYTKDTFNRIGRWFDIGINNWATTDVLCMLVLSSFMIDNVIDTDDLKAWNDSESEWKRRAVPVTLIELIKKDLKPAVAIYAIEPLMLDKSEYVQKGIGTLLRGLWKKYPSEIETFLLKWKDQCGRLIIQYATEKMEKEYRVKFRKVK